MHCPMHAGPLLALTLLLLAVAPAFASPKADAEAIARHRMGTIIVKTQAGRKVKVTQLRHEFWFGTALSRKMFRDGIDPKEKQQYLKLVKENFNCAVHENALKWYGTESKKQGKVSYADADRMLAWCEENDILMRGHCIFWCVDRYVQDWIKQLDDDSLRKTVQRRAGEVTSRYAGRIVEYDVNNEMLHGGFFKNRLGEDIRVKMFQWAREGDPKAVLYLNDYNILSGKSLDAYEKQIEWFLKAGAPVGGIGCQGHFPRTVNLKKAKEALDRLARFKLPIRITEFDINTDDEGEKARLLEGFYRTCFAHPAVEGILMWGFWEGAHWRPKAALWNRDFTPRPAALKYRELVFNRWWTRWEGQADAKGECRVPAFYGKHLVEVGAARKEVTLGKAHGKVEVALAPKPMTSRPKKKSD